ncbi:MFS transporter, partial [Mycobacterium kansasii]
FAAASVGATLLIPTYFQLVSLQTPMQAGLHLAPVGLGALVTLPLAGAFMDKHGPGKIVLIGLPLMAVGLGIFTWGIARQVDYLP